jgi:hypothetical protein
MNDATCQNCNTPINSTFARFCGKCERTLNPPKFTVLTCYGWGWRIPQEPESPRYGTLAEAKRYAQARNNGLTHRESMDAVTSDVFSGKIFSVS